jgi:nitrate reductase (NAD(P)H)
VAGEDATEDFMAIHSSDARRQLADFHIGTLVGHRTTNQEVTDNATGPFLEGKKWKKVILVSVNDVSADSKLFQFALQRHDQELGLPVGNHVYVRLRRKAVHRKDCSNDLEGELVQKAYTPVSRQDDKGFIELLIK